MANRYWVGGTGTWDATSTTNWSASSGGASGASVPVAGDTAIFDQAATYTVGMSFTTALTVDAIINSAGTVTFAGTVSLGITLNSLTLTATAVWSTTANMTISGTGSFTLDTKGVVLNSSITLGTVGSTWTLASNFAMANARTMSHQGGTLNLASFTLTTSSFSSASTNTRVLAFGTGKVIINGSTTGGVVALTMTNMTLTGTRRFDISRSAGNASISCLGATAGNAPIVYVTTGTYVFTINAGAGLDGLDFTGFTGTATFTSGTIIRLHAGLTLGTGMTVGTSAANVTFDATSGTNVITSNGVAVNHNWVFDGVGGTWQLADAATLTNTNITLNSGTLNTNSKAVACTAFTSSSANTRVLAMGTTVLTFSSTFTVAGTVSSFSITGTGTISTATTFGAKTFAGGGYLGYPTLRQNGSGSLSITGSNKFADVTNVVGVGTGALSFATGASNEFTAFNLNGQSGALLTVNSSTFGTQTILRKATAWLVGANSTDGGGNTGLTFTVGGGVDYLNLSYINGLGLPVTYASSVTDTATALDTPSAIKSIDRAVTDTANALDGVLTITPVDAAVEDTAIGGDITAATPVFGAATTESSTAQDVLTAGNVATAATTNSATALDATAANFAIPSALTESATALDATASTKTMPGAVSDTATALDAPSALAAFRSATSDSATALDAPTGLTVYVAAVANTAAGSDSMSVAFLPMANVSDTARPTDATSSVFIQLVTGSVAEGASAADLVTVLPSTFTVLMIEGAAAQDVLNTNTTFRASLADGVMVIDAAAAAYLWNLIDDSQTPNWQNASTTQTPGWQDVNDAQSPGWTQVNT